MPLTTLAAWLHDLNPFLWRIHGEIGIRWYGLAYLAGFVAGWWWLVQLARRRYTPVTPQRIGDFVVALLLGVIVGGRLGYVLFYKPHLLWTFFADVPWWGVLEINRGGMSSHGGMIGVIIACVWFARRWVDDDGVRRGSVSSLHLLDLVAATCPAGLMFGRIANFINGELLGRIYAPPGAPSPWWTVKFPQELVSGHECGRTAAQEESVRLLASSLAPPDGELVDGLDRAIAIIQSSGSVLRDDVVRQIDPLLSSRYPSQLFQAVTDGPLLAAVLWIAWMRPRLPGVIGCWFMLAYGVMRIATEHWRLPDTDIALATILGLSRGQWLSIAMVLVGVVGIAIIRIRAARLAIQPVGGWWRESPSAT